MSAFCGVVGRVAQLQNIISRPELNGAYVSIQAYLPETDRFSARILPSPNTNADSLTIAVKLASIAVCWQQEQFEKEITVIHLEQLKQSAQKKLLNFVSDGSQRIVGAKTALRSTGIPDPKTKHFGDVDVALTAEDGMAEFEDIHFIGTEKDEHVDAVVCSKGHFIAFRRCVFDTIRIFVGVNVVFENCVIDAGVLRMMTIGVCVKNDASTTLLNCVIRNCGTGVVGLTRSRICMKHCLFENCVNGATFDAKLKSIDMFRCSVMCNPHDGGSCVHVSTSGSATICHCRMENRAGMGITLGGKAKHITRVLISDCHILGCQHGLVVEYGEFAATISTTVFRNNFKCGLMVFPAAIGHLTVSQCHMVDNGAKNIVNGSAAEDMLMVDGVVQKAVQVPYMSS